MKPLGQSPSACIWILLCPPGTEGGALCSCVKSVFCTTEVYKPGDASVEVLQAEHTRSQLRLPRTHGETIDAGPGYLHTRPLLAELPRPSSFTHPPCHRGPEQFDDRPARSPYLCFVASQLPSVRRLWARRDINVPLPDTARQPGLLVYNNNMPAVFRPSCWLWLFPPFPLRRAPFPPRPSSSK